MALSNIKSVSLFIVLLKHIIYGQQQVIYSTTFDSSPHFSTWTTWCDGVGDGAVPCTNNEVALQSGSVCTSKFNDSNCMRLSGQAPAIHRSVSFTNYENIRLEFELYAVGLDAYSGGHDNCNVYYSIGPQQYYPSSSNQWITFDYNYNNGYYYKSFNFPSSLNNAPEVHIYLEIWNRDSDSGDQCWYDNFVIYGTSLTPKPTPNPTPRPTSQAPTQQPTNQPTIPTGNPIPSPSESPTDNPTQFPSESPTDNPSITPDPTSSPTTLPTLEPSQKPTTSISDDLSPSPTIEPTLNPASSPLITKEEQDEETSVRDEFSWSEWIKRNIALFTLIIVGIILLCCVPVVTCIYCYKVKSRKNQIHNNKREPDNIVMTSKFDNTGAMDRVSSVESVPSPSSHYNHSVNFQQNLPQQPYVHRQNEDWTINTPNFPRQMTATTVASDHNSMYNNDSDFDHGMTTTSPPYGTMTTSPSTNSSGGQELKPIKELRGKDTYMTWNHGQISDWILSLHNAAFRKYEAILRHSLRECNLKGRSLKMVNSTDIMDWGIKDFEHRKLLQYYIHELINSDKNLENLTVEGNAELNI